MKPYKVTLEVTQTWAIEVHARDEQEAKETAKNLDLDQIMDGGDYDELLNVTVSDVEPLLVEDE